jgi:hypothetical protein
VLVGEDEVLALALEVGLADALGGGGHGWFPSFPRWRMAAEQSKQ